MSDERLDDGALRDALPDWVAGRLRAEEARAVRDAVEADADLASEARLLAAMLEARPEAPPGLAARIEAEVRRERAAVATGRAPGRASSRSSRGWSPWRGISRWSLAAAAVAVLALGTLEMAERSVGAGVGSGPLEEVALEDAPSPWTGDDIVVAGAPVLDGLSDEALSSLLEELGG